MSKKKFQLVPPKEIKVTLNSLESLLTRQSDKEFIENICSNAHPEVLMALINKKMLGTGIEPIIELTTEALIVNLCSYQQYKGRQYTYNKPFAKFIEVYGGIIIDKIYPTDRGITCNTNSQI